MTFVIITHVPHIVEQDQYFAYAPYVLEMNSWIKEVSKVIIVAPMSLEKKSPIDLEYQHQDIEFVKVESFDILHLKSLLGAVIKVPAICWQIFKVMKNADHIHLRCPGNMGLLGSMIQMFFPSKPKTAKYAGNWDPKSKQPRSYCLQKWILNNTFLTKNMQVLVYGEWEGSSKNIKSFFTASYKEVDKLEIENKELNSRINFLFVGTLVKGKNPMYAIQLVEKLAHKGFDVVLQLYGEGIERKSLEQYIIENNLGKNILLEGNQSQEIVKNAYQHNHFVVLPSVSEGWPKAVAEGMFWGCVPIATPISCVPFMLDYGKRGVLLEMDLEVDILQIISLLDAPTDYDSKRINASNWSRKYTLDVFEKEIKNVLQQ